MQNWIAFCIPHMHMLATLLYNGYDVHLRHMIFQCYYGNFIILYHKSVISIKLSMLQKIFSLLLNTKFNSLVNYRQKEFKIMWPMYIYMHT